MFRMTVEKWILWCDCFDRIFASERGTARCLYIPSLFYSTILFDDLMMWNAAGGFGDVRIAHDHDPSQVQIWRHLISTPYTVSNFDSHSRVTVMMSGR